MYELERIFSRALSSRMISPAGFYTRSSGENKKGMTTGDAQVTLGGRNQARRCRAQLSGRILNASVTLVTAQQLAERRTAEPGFCSRPSSMAEPLSCSYRSMTFSGANRESGKANAM
jgi:hypothetical protein